MKKTATGLFDDYSDARAAVSALEARGIPSDDISIVSNNVDEGRTGDTNAAEGAGAGAGIGRRGGVQGGVRNGPGRGRGLRDGRAGRQEGGGEMEDGGGHGSRGPSDRPDLSHAGKPLCLGTRGL